MTRAFHLPSQAAFSAAFLKAEELGLSPEWGTAFSGAKGQEWPLVVTGEKEKIQELRGFIATLS